MAQVPEQTLQWLYNALHVSRRSAWLQRARLMLLQDYQDPQRTYSDTARTLSLYPSLLPATEVYTQEDGTSSLLLRLAGTVPAAFRGTTYRFPVKIWIPHAYPYEAPFAYVVPGKEMVVRPGQHVGVDGRIYHPYLRDWGRIWDRANTSDFLDHLSQVFSREPPVISRAQQQQYQQRSNAPAQPGPAPPQLPPKRAVGGLESSQLSGVGTPPPLPPKPGEEYAEARRDVARDGPPLPPLPHEAAHQPRSSSLAQNTYRPTPRTPSQNILPPSPMQQNGRSSGTPFPPFQHEQSLSQHQHYRAHQDRSPVSPVSPINRVSELPGNKYVRPAPLPQPQSQPPLQQPTQWPMPHYSHQEQSSYEQKYSQIPHQHPSQQAWLQGQIQHQQRPKEKQAAPDLLTDPFDVAIPASGPSLPAPPIPPNPEKEHLLQAISTSLVQQAQQKVNQNLSAIAPLHAQEYALRMAQDRLEGEIRQLEQLEQAISINESILHRSIQDCDRTIATARSKKQPAIDEVLLAPTMVANQLWNLCAEEAACREAMYFLQKAVDRGRIRGDVFVRQMRNLGRECFLKMAQARKCALGMGLHTPYGR
ncbi:uncharacterized protein MYCFIDRAFT_25096 [Pseudocercospora fijiensis CIRAD86]|uniref:UEV domain-containing protein n=1 Tax=Pseudocercospora fijiensis (strain CIRAD86) TaxID=383855 RepID=N1QB75_PSEFD|nr:uncharacterized protein MYCFIDRAFT_25096 [Pseudocercospora fijiensis CIRAD86]EME88382.1 hypothetical protein MYCFIDRAFT_25096 [Pseudocercospora fijiensis CIRAD86]